MLKSICACKKVSYCDDSCRQKDEKYHLAHCEAEAQIDVTKLKFEQSKFARNGVAGL